MTPGRYGPGPLKIKCYKNQINMIFKLKPRFHDKRTLIHKFLMILSSIMKDEPSYFISTHEVYLLTELMLLPEKYKYARFSVAAKKFIINSMSEHYGLKISSQNLNTKIYSLIGKEFIWRDEDKVLYLASIIERFIEQLNQADLNDLQIEIGFVKTTT